MKRKIIEKLTALVLCLCLLCACGSGSRGNGEEELPDIEGPIGKELAERQAVDKIFSLNYDPEAPMNPIRAESSANMQFWGLMYDSVFTVDENFNVSSDIVLDYTSEDFQWWTFNVRTDVNFSDGTPLRAGDVAYSIRMAQQSDHFKQRLSCVLGVSALTEDMFAISTVKADSLLPALLNIPIIKMGDYFEDFPVGSGPYILSPARDRLVLNRENRHAAEMPVDTVYLKNYMDTSARITAFEEASIDIVTNDPTGMYNLGYGSTNETRYYDTTNLHFIGFNTRSNYFQLFRMRAGVGALVDRDYVVDELMNGCGAPAALPVHPRSGLYDPDYAATFRYDPELARTLFEAAGVADLDGDGALEILVTGIVVEFRVKFIVNNDSSVKVAAARRITEELNALGITTTLYELSWDDFIKALEEGDYDLYYGEVRLGMDWDLSYLFQVPSASDRGKSDGWGMNYSKTTDESYTTLYDSYLAASDVSRYEAFQQAAHYIGDSAILIPVCFERRQVLTHRGVVSGLRSTQFDLFHAFSDWTITLD